MSNECPNCRQQAMNSMAKIIKRPFVCQHCGQELRLNLIYAALLSAVYLFLVIRLFLGGLTAGSMLVVLLLTVAFVVACLFVPLELKKENSQSG